jgi:hypothetical protein
MTLRVRRYSADEAQKWNEFLARSKNGTFLFNRGYMDYHSERFHDRSYIVERGGAEGELVAVIPANVSGDNLYSHQGLTYGGFIVGSEMTTPLMLEVFDEARRCWRAEGFKKLHYKTIPSIYCRLPAEEDRYALFRQGAQLVRRDVLSVVLPATRPPVQERRRRGLKKAQKAGVEVVSGDAFSEFWMVLESNLRERHGAAPVHSLDEIMLLRERFSENISLYEARITGRIVAGVVTYEEACVCHVQYIASTEEARNCSALDAVFTFLMERARVKGLIFDFGISNEDGGKILNQGLIEQKEGYGARAIAHDFYDLEL